MSLTESQQEAIAARGNVLVVAGAGTGKTSTLVERCLACLFKETPPASIDEILMVTFTEAAAAEMRKRIRDRLEEEDRRNPGVPRWQEQLALFETAHFGTLHSFCFRLVREHFYELELDPQLAILPQEEARVLAEETLDALLQRHYGGVGPEAKAVQQLIQTQGRGWDRPIRGLVLRLHHYAQTTPNPSAWLAKQLAFFASPGPDAWRTWWSNAATELPLRWLPLIEASDPANPIARQCAAALRGISLEPNAEALANCLGQIAAARKSCPRGKKGSWVDPLEKFFADADFLSSLISLPGKSDPLAEDWAWVRAQMTTLLELSREFAQAFTEAKRELGVLDFHDLEQYSLRLLWDQAANRPTSIANYWRKKLRFVFVDEYQDINAAQDQILQALAREGSQANRFLVGDVKQSIYRFRLANPQIFQRYAEHWNNGPGRVVPLVDNFRSKENLLNFVNSVFGLLVTRDLGGVDYAKDAALRFGAPGERAVLSTTAGKGPATELHLLLRTSPETIEQDEEASEALAEIVDLQEADKEARLVGLRLRELHSQQVPVWDSQVKDFRPITWKDMAILLRSPAKKAESYAKEFARLNLPLHVARAGFYQSTEVTDLLSLLQLLDNPLQDLPLLAVLHSPLVGLTANDLAEIRLNVPKAHFWTALTRWHRQNAPTVTPPLPHNDRGREARARVGVFLNRFSRWRPLARCASLSHCLETVLAETHYSSWLLTQPRGTQRHANIQRLLTLAQDFDQFQRRGLFRFLRFIEAQKAVDSEPEVGSASTEDAIRLMSIHQSKGLEFPLVVVADLAKPFNFADVRGDVILDEQFGLCPRVKPPHTGKRYPSLSHWLARRRQLPELLGEELRLLYVAMTRARDWLILCGLVAESRLDSHWRRGVQPKRETFLSARGVTDWLASWFALNVGFQSSDGREGQTPLLRWFIHDAAGLVRPEEQSLAREPLERCEIDFDSPAWRQVQQRLGWEYPFGAATRQPAKTSVSVLRRQAALDDPEAAAFPPRKNTATDRPDTISSPSAMRSAAAIGSAHHQFLQLFSLDQAGSPGSLAEEARRLESEGRLTSEQLAVLDFESLAHFWQSPLGLRVRSQSAFVRRELAFTGRFSLSELALLSSRPPEASMFGEFVLVQGIADLVVLAPKEIWLIDFKTDQLKPQELSSRVKLYTPQVSLYCKALARIYRRPVIETWLHFLSLRHSVSIDS